MKPLVRRSVSGFSCEQSLAMKAAGAGLLTRQEGGSDLHGLRAERQSGYYAPRIRYSTRGDHRHVNDVGHLRHERKRAHEGILSGPEE